ncbi:MAG: glycosyltransferase [Nitrospirota bacterium]
MKVLFTSPILEHPAAGGPQLRIENTIKALSRISDLHVIARTPGYAIGGERSLQFYRGYCHELSIAPSAAGLSSNRYVNAVQRRYRRRLHAEADADHIVRYAESRDISVIWFGYGNISLPLIRSIKRKKPELKLVCDTDSVWSRFILRELPFENDPRRRAALERQGRAKEREEQEWVNLCDLTTAVSAVDDDYYRGLAIDPGRIMRFSNVIDLETYRAPEPPGGIKRPCMYLAGTFGHMHSPMDRAARWVLEEVLPIVRQQIPDMHYYIVGRGTEHTLGKLNDPRVTVTGKLPSVLPYLYHADVALVPLQFESGTRFKILEAGACGIPIVSTTLGAEGLPVQNGVHLLLADDPASFAGSVIRIIQDREFAQTLAANCRSLIEGNYSLTTLVREGSAILKRIAS